MWGNSSFCTVGVVLECKLSFSAEEGPSKQSDPGQRSWAQVVNPVAMAELSVTEAESQLCPFGVVGECRFVYSL